MRIFRIIISTIILSIASIVFYYGGFSSVIVTERELPALTLAYDTHTGDYSKIKPVMDKIYYTLRYKEKIEPPRGFGLYYDNPQTTEKSKLRSIAGCILETNDQTAIDSLQKKGYKIAVFPATKAIIVEFPLKGQLSVLFGVFKVYPKIGKYMQEKKIQPVPMMEIYNIPQKKIQYIVGYQIDNSVYDSFIK